jgi:hypothetical protein
MLAMMTWERAHYLPVACLKRQAAVLLYQRLKSLLNSF